MSDTRDDQHGARDGAIKSLCRTLKMPTIAREFASTERVALAEGWAPAAYLHTLLDAEASTRTEHAVERRLRAARLPARKTLAQFDWRRSHGVERARVEVLARCEWVAQARNIVLLGPVGTGKTHLAIALAMAAMGRGYGAMFFRASELVRALSEARDTRQLGRLHERLQRSEVLVLDELGFVPFERAGGELLFDVLSTRHERRATVITSNLSFGEWNRVFCDDKLTTALLDRLAQHADVIVTRGPGARVAGAVSPGEGGDER